MSNQEQQQERPRRPVGPDSCRSWMVAVACSWNLLWSSLVRRSTGVIYVALVRTFGASRERSSWVLSVGTSLAWLIGPLVGAGTRYVPLVVLSFLGCIITAVSAIGCAFARDMTAVFFLLGICSGIGNGIGMPTNDVTIGKYFRRYRGSASGIYYAGGTVAAFAFPPIMNLLLQEYGFLGTFLITGGLMLNAVAACPFHRAPPWEKVPKGECNSSSGQATSGACGDLSRRSPSSINQSERVAMVKGTCKAIVESDTVSAGADKRNGRDHESMRPNQLVNGAPILKNGRNVTSYKKGSFTDHDPVENAVVTSADEGSSVDRAASDIVAATCEYPQYAPPIRSLGLSFSFIKEKKGSGAHDQPPCSFENGSHKQQKAVSNISGSVDSSVPSLVMSSELSSGNHTEIALSEVAAAGAIDIAKDRSRRGQLPQNAEPQSSTPWGYLRLPVFYMVCVTCAFNVYNNLVLMILVDFAMEMGFTRHDGAVLLSVSAIGDACARVGAGVLSDRPFCDRRFLMGTSALLAGIVCVAMPQLHIGHYVLTVVLCALFGWSNGTMVVLFGPILADQVGVESLGLSSGTCRFVMGVAYLACPKITGYFKDKVGSYNGLFYFVSVCCFLVGIMWTVDFVCRFIKRRRRRALGLLCEDCEA